MLKHYYFYFALLFSVPALSATLTEAPTKEKPPAPLTQQPAKPAAYLELGWDELMPPYDEALFKRFEAGEVDRQVVIDHLHKLGNTPVKALNGKEVLIPGYLVPLDFQQDQKSTQLLLVPTVGACIHVPAPPANQTIYLNYPQGIKVTEAGYTPYIVEGRLLVSDYQSDLANAVYRIDVSAIREFK